MNPLIEQVLTGNIDMEQFLKKLQDDPELQEYIRRLVLLDALAGKLFERLCFLRFHLNFCGCSFFRLLILRFWLVSGLAYG